MASGGFANVPKRVISSFVFQLVILGIGVALTVHMVRVSKVADQNTRTVTAALDDWQTVPFTELTVTDGKCPKGTESVFVREWAGTEKGCLVNKLTYFGFSSEQAVMTVAEYDSYIRSRIDTHSSSDSDDIRGHQSARRSEPCLPISMKPAKTQDEFFDKRFCGKRGGTSFLNAVRPELGKEKSASCPSGYTPCSKETSIDHTICVQEAKTSECPFTMMKFISKSEESQYPADDYQTYTVDDELSFVTSKTKGDNLPLTSFKIEDKPCLDHRFTSQSEAAKFYPLEKDRKNEDCKVVQQFDQSHDTRYLAMGAEISEYEIQKESKVLDTLESLPNFGEYVSDDDKKKTMYKFWSRSTIPWKLSCQDQQGSFVKAAESEKGKLGLHSTAVICLVSIAYGGGAIISFAAFLFYLNGKLERSSVSHGVSKGLCGGLLGLQIVLLAISFGLIHAQRDKLDERLEATQALVKVNDCSDEFSQVPSYFVTDTEKATENARSNVILGSAQLLLALTTLVSCVCGGGSESREDATTKYQPLPNDEDENL